MTPEDVELRCEEMQDDLHADLQAAALFELFVEGNTVDLDPSYIVNPVTDLGYWEPAFLSLDGEQAVYEGQKAPPSLSDFRVAIWIPEWAESSFLSSPWGDLTLPAFQPVP